LSLKSFRFAVRDELATRLGLPFLDGYVEGPIQTRDLGCIWSVGKRENDENVQEEIVELRARVFRRWVQVRDEQQPIDTGPLEDMAESIQTALKDDQVRVTWQQEHGIWMFRVTQVEIVLERQAVEATIVALQANLFAP
jgi:hypothetical protein